ncbi:hypothetical protein HK102_004019, partial [Quaeritorhiza haematococci]
MAILPGYRDHPKHILLWLTFSLAIFESLPLIRLFFTEKEIHCKDDRTVATGKNNIPCAVEGVLITFGLWATMIWFLFLLINLYWTVVTQTNSLRRYALLMHVICWTTSTTLSFIAYYLGDIRAQADGFCLPSKYIFIYFIPFGVMFVVMSVLVAVTVWRVFSSILRSMGSAMEAEVEDGEMGGEGAGSGSGSAGKSSKMIVLREFCNATLPHVANISLFVSAGLTYVIIL